MGRRVDGTFTGNPRFETWNCVFVNEFNCIVHKALHNRYLLISRLLLGCYEGYHATSACGAHTCTTHPLEVIRKHEPKISSLPPKFLNANKAGSRSQREIRSWGPAVFVLRDRHINCEGIFSPMELNHNEGVNLLANLPAIQRVTGGHYVIGGYAF